MRSSESHISFGHFIANSMIGLGIFNTIIFGTFTLSVMMHPELSFVYRILGFLITGWGISLIVFGRKRMKLIDEFRRYQILLSTNSTGSIVSLANAINSPKEEVIKKLNLMIKRKFFKDVYIDIASECILPGTKVVSKRKIEEKQNFITVACDNCGASNKIINGKVGECEYCGSPLSWKKK